LREIESEDSQGGNPSGLAIPGTRPRERGFRQDSRTLYFAIEGINGIATPYFAGYIFFLLRDRYGFGNLGNLATSALGGFVYVFAAWQGGRFAQRFGYFTSLKTGVSLGRRRFDTKSRASAAAASHPVDASAGALPPSGSGPDGTTVSAGCWGPSSG
jgi:hypothetical protein